MKHVKKVLSALVILSAISTAHAQQQMGGPGGGQDNGGPGGPGGGPDGGPPDPQQMQEMMDNRIKSALGASDDTWSTLQPLIDKVTQLEHETDTGPLLHGRPHRPGGDADANDGGPGGGGGAQGAPADPGPGGQDAGANGGPGGGGPGGGGPGGGGPGGPGGDGPDAQDDNHPRSAVESAISDLKKVLSDKSASDGKIQTAMKAAQDAEQKAKDDLEAARKDLRNAVNLRQQAVLVALGVLN